MNHIEITSLVLKKIVDEWPTYLSFHRAFCQVMDEKGIPFWNRSDYVEVYNIFIHAIQKLTE